MSHFKDKLYKPRKRIVDPRQITLFEREERAAIIEYHGGIPRKRAEQLSGISYIWRGPLPYLIDLIDAGEPLIHLFGNNKHIVLIRTLTSYENQNAIKHGWVNRKDAENALIKGGYTNNRTLTTHEGKGQVWHKQNV